eukprot:12093863-Ditylum_brightwellii.AAC.1
MLFGMQVQMQQKIMAPTQLLNNLISVTERALDNRGGHQNVGPDDNRGRFQYHGRGNNMGRHQMSENQ